MWARWETLFSLSPQATKIPTLLILAIMEHSSTGSNQGPHPLSSYPKYVSYPICGSVAPSHRKASLEEAVAADLH